MPVFAAVAATAILLPGAAAAAAPASDPPLKFVAAASAVTLESWQGEPVYLDLGTHVVAGSKPFEVWLKRASYGDPIVVTQVLPGGRRKTLHLDPGMVTDFAGFQAFTHVTIKDPAGTTVADLDQTFCPNGEGVRSGPAAPDTSPYPFDCPTNPFTLGSVWGIQAGWAVPTFSWWSQPVALAEGTYTATVTVTPAYRALLGIPDAQSSATIQLTVKNVTGPGKPLRAGAAPGASVPLRPAAARPAGAASVPKGPKPDLRTLPAWGIQVTDGSVGGGETVPGDFLAFNATVWIGGSSPLVVDGFRRDGQDIMDAYQYFYDSKGNQIGYAPVGTMEWDPRDGHNHWHFADFAQYRLLDANKQLAVRSTKEAFCLASTDAVDYTIPHANWRPNNRDLHTACGGYTALAVREVLDLGNGDTYAQWLPGQSFDITNLANGTYYIEVAANPDKNLYEQDTANNVSYRQVILGGTAGARTVTVPPLDGIAG
jgi:hypothetical protein